MSQIKIATQNKKKPHSKIPVYFAACDADFRKYFDTLCDDIFTNLDCAIYYYEPGQTPDKSVREFELSQMQMFVVVVTQNFMNKKFKVLNEIGEMEMKIFHGGYW